ncbi:MAG: TonB-dependent receptor [Ignavibacteriales bacterium]|nr:TonB-dependent receptor [Ignavibacteriales bacterium]
MKQLINIFCFLLLPFTFALAQSGSIRGTITDKENKSSIPGANIVVQGTKRGAITDPDGRFQIPDLPVGSYIIQISFLGYEPQRIADVIVKSARSTVLDAELKPSVLEIEGASVTGSYYTVDETQPTSVTAFSYEEIRRSPGSAGDVSRIIYGLPSVAKANDERNNLIVRGGSPIENAFYVDNIEFPNINHFPTQGSSGGAVSIINIDLIKNVNFRTGGFSSAYGDRLSSIMEISLREGNREKVEGQVELSMSGVGTVLEGSLGGGKGSWIFSARRSYVDLLAKIGGFGVAPKYGDAQAAAVYDLDQQNRVSFTDVFAMDINRISKEDASDLDFSVYGQDDQLQNTVGMNWRHLWDKTGFSNTSVSHTFMRYTTNFREGRSDELLIVNKSTEQFVQLRHSTHLQLGQSHAIDAGFNVKHSFVDYNNYFGSSTNAGGDSTAAFNIVRSLDAQQAGAFATYTWIPVSVLDISVGARADYFSFNKRVHISPRAAFCLRLSETTSLTGAAGIYYQSLPFFFLSQNDAYRSLHDLKAVQYVLGVERYLTEDTKLSLEAYRKEYSEFPMNPDEPTIFALDEIFYGSPYFFKENNLINAGKAYAQGIEITLQKKLAEDFYGLASVSLSTARYKDMNGTWRDRVFSNKAIFSIEGGYKPNNKWEFSMRWIYAGGTPYTPFDEAASTAINRGVLDESRTNAVQNPDYHSLNLRVDRRFNFDSTNLVLYLSVWNVYDRKNVATHYWNEFKNAAAVQYQWSTLPIIGAEYEF